MSYRLLSSSHGAECRSTHIFKEDTMSDAGVALGNMLFAIAWLVGGVWWASKVEGCFSQLFTFVFGGFLIGFIVEVLYVCIIALLR